MARPTKEPPIASSIIPPIVRHAAASGVDVEALALRFELPQNARDTEIVTVASDVPNELLSAIDRAASEPDVAIRVASELTGRRHKLVELAVRSSIDVRGAAQRLARWVALIHDGLEASLEDGDSHARWTLRTPRRPRGAGRYVHEVALAHALLEIRAGVDGVTAACVWFAHARPPHVAALVRFFGTSDLLFGQEESGFALRTPDLARTMKRADVRTVETIEPLVDAELGATGAHGGLAERVAARIAASLPDGSDVSAVADALHMSSRTLQRRLEEEGTRFTEVLDRARLDVARRLLADPSKELVEIAFGLGFADLATFSRAFKRWTGKPPGQWRRS